MQNIKLVLHKKKKKKKFSKRPQKAVMQGILNDQDEFDLMEKYELKVHDK